MAISVDGRMVTLVADCEPQSPTLGQGPRFISTAGLTVLGTQDLGEETFEVGVQWSGKLRQGTGRSFVQLQPRTRKLERGSGMHHVHLVVREIVEPLNNNAQWHILDSG